MNKALEELDPAHIQQLYQQFLPQVMQSQNAMGQTAIAGLRERAGMSGLLNTPFALTSEAGLRGQLANQASTQAFSQAMGLAGQRASAITGAQMPPSPYGAIGQQLQGGVNNYLLYKALSQQTRAPQYPYVVGGTNYNVGGPSGGQIQQTEGTPYQWPFYGGH